jgi:hypothetical protein
VLVNAAETGDEVVFERSDGTFGGIASVDAGGRKLKIDVFLEEELFSGDGTLVVKVLEAWAEAGGTKFGMEGLIAGKYGSSGTCLDGGGEDAVAIKVVEDEEVVIAIAGRGDKSAGLVTEDLSGGFHDGGIAEVGAIGWSGAGGCNVFVVKGRRG